MARPRLRAVRPGGCSGYSYEMYFDKDFTPDDTVADEAVVAPA